MTNRTITARSNTLTGFTGGAQYTNGSATVDDATKGGKAAIEYAKRHGFAVSGGIATAVDLTPADGEVLIRWTTAELKAYLTDKHVTFPADATDEQLRDAIRDAIDIKAQGGSAANESAGHTSGTYPPEGAPPVSNPDKPDTPSETVKWATPLSVANETLLDPPVVTSPPVLTSKVAPATATFTVVATGEDLHYQWARQAKGVGSYVDIEGAEAASYTTPATTVADNNGDRYRVTISNENGTVTTTGVVLTVTAS